MLKVEETSTKQREHISEGKEPLFNPDNLQAGSLLYNKQ